MDRTLFYNKVTNDDIEEYDHLHNNLSNFRTYYPIQYYRIESDDIMRPDLISYKVYDTIKFWWLIMMFNNINDTFNEMVVGTLLKIPNVLDIYSFYKKYSLR